MENNIIENNIETSMCSIDDCITTIETPICQNLVEEKPKKTYYVKKSNPQKRGPKAKLTDDDKKERHAQLLDYHKEYYRLNKERLKKINYSNYDKNRNKLIDLKKEIDPNYKPRNRKREKIQHYISMPIPDIKHMSDTQSKITEQTDNIEH